MVAIYVGGEMIIQLHGMFTLIELLEDLLHWKIQYPIPGNVWSLLWKEANA